MTLEEYKNKNNKKNNKNSKKYVTNLLTRSLITIILVFGVLIMVNFDKDFKSDLEKYLFKTNYNFSSINKLYNNYFADFLKTSKDSVAVFEEIKLLNGGIVVFIGEKEGYGNTVIVQQSNGTDAWYGNIKKVDVKLYDYLEKGETLGKASEKLYLVFQKDGEYLDYKENI